MAAVIPVSTSPEPPFAMPGFPAFSSQAFPSGKAVTVPAPLSTVTQPYFSAKAAASLTRSPVRFPPSRANSPAWGVITVRPAAERSISGCRDTAHRASASSTSRPGKPSTTPLVSSAVSSLRPRPGPSASTSMPLQRSFSGESASAVSFPVPSQGSGKGMASVFFTAHTVQIASGTPRYTSPAPERTAAAAARLGAPV